MSCFRRPHIFTLDPTQVLVLLIRPDAITSRGLMRAFRSPRMNLAIAEAIIAKPSRFTEVASGAFWFDDTDMTQNEAGYYVYDGKVLKSEDKR